LSSWVLEDFNYGEISGQIIKFKVFNLEYLMLFNPIDDLYDSSTIEEKSSDLGITYKPNSFNVKFDLQSNFDSGEYYNPPGISLSIVEMRLLGKIVRDLFEFHYLNSNSEAYLFIAENCKLKRFYDRLAKKYLTELKFTIKANLGEENLGYEITTARYKG
jgi:hypothetical protein